MKAFLKRKIDDGKATIGTFFFDADDGVKNLASLELAWKDNQKSVSCIPKGTYKVKTTFSNKYQKDMWQVLDVPGRTGIRIHSANYYKQLEGCIALGSSIVDMDGDKTLDITDSRDAIAFAYGYLGDEFDLEIL